MKESVSPEEKLLRLIRGQKNTKQVPSETPRPYAEVAGKKEMALVQGINFSGHFVFPSSRKILVSALSIACLYLAASIAYRWVDLRHIKFPQATKQEMTQFKFTDRQEKRPFNFYQDEIKKHSIFGLPIASENSKPIGIPTSDLIKDISLVGIISGANPQAIVEDKKNQNTYYVNKGQYIGEFLVEDILEGKIILNYNGQRYELYL